MFTKSAQFYEAIYSWKDYAAESETLHNLIQKHKQTTGNTLLDVACGTGGHITHLRKHYTIEGLDLENSLLQIASKHHPDVIFHEANMVYFDLGKQFDALVCLFSSIGYVKSISAMFQTIQNFSNHVKPGGVVIVEPWFRPGEMNDHTIHARFVDEPDLKITRMNRTVIEDRVAVLDFHYLVGTPQGVEYFDEHHELGLFTHEEYMDAFRAAEMSSLYDEAGLMGRGLYFGIRQTG